MIGEIELTFLGRAGARILFNLRLATWRNPARMLICTVLATCPLCVVLPLASASAQSSDARETMRCMACHSGAKRSEADRMTKSARGGTINIPDFRDADHGKTHCLDCHKKGFDIFPHRSKQTSTCMDCHPRKEKGAAEDKPYEFERIHKEFEETVHFTEYQNAPEKCCGTAVKTSAAKAPTQRTASPHTDPADHRFTCEHCHEPHYFKATRRIKEPLLIRDNDNAPCLRCHKDGATGPLADPAKPSLLAAHRYLAHAQIHLDRTRCVDCHTNVKTKVAHDLPKGKAADQGCNTCHSVDSVLLTRLYRYTDVVEPRLGFHNTRLLQDGYVMGGTRNKWLDIAAYLLMSVGFALVLTHGGWRIVAKRKKQQAP